MFLTILAVIGKVLLIIVIILAVLVAAILFTPFFYRADIRKQEEGDLQLRFRLWGVLHLIWFRLDLREGKPVFELHLFGLPLLKLLGFIKKAKEKKQAKKAAKAAAKAQIPGPEDPGAAEQPAGDTAAAKPPPEDTMGADGSAKAEPPGDAADAEKPGDAAGTEPPGGAGEARQEMKKPSVLRKIADVLLFILTLPVRIAKGIAKVFSAIAAALKNIYSLFRVLTSRTFREAVKTVIREGKALILHIFPKKIRGFIRFGTGDPGNTGYILAVAAAFYPILPERLEIIPEFEEKCLEADVQLKGRLVIIFVLVHVIRLLKDKNVKRVIEYFKKRRNSHGKS